MQAFELGAIQAFVDDMNSSNSINVKKTVLAKHESMKPLLAKLYDPFSKLGVTSANVKKIGSAKRQKLSLDGPAPTNLAELIDGLEQRKWTGHAAICACQLFVEANPEHSALIYSIIDKDLRIGVKPTLINAVFPGLIPQFQVVLAKDYEEVADKVDFAKQDWYSSRKLDGVRCLIMIDAQGEPTFWSRGGNEFTSLDNAKADIKSLGLCSVVLDSEACILNDDGSENFASVVGQIKRKGYTIEKPKLCVFDLIDLDDFLQGKGAASFSKRHAELSAILGKRNLTHLVQLKQRKINALEELTAESDHAHAQGWEGLILRKDVPYAAKRSNDTLKVKRFLEAEFTVLECEMGLKQMVINKKKQQVPALASVVVEFQGCKVNVGSGFTDEERIKIHADPASIIGKQITVQYFEATENKHGGKSMRFPTKKMIWWEKRDV